MSAYNQEMFAKISEAMKSTTGQTSNFGNVLRFKPGNTYTLRLLPNVESPLKTLFHYYFQGWNSLATGQYISAISPSTWDERDPISEAKFRLSKHGSEQEKEDSRLLTRRENWLMNVYVVNDPTDGENNGKNKILRFGKQLHKIIMAGIEGEDSDEFGSRVFDLSADGCSLKIKVEEQGGYSTYVSSRFASAQKIPGLVDEESINAVYKNIYDLENVFPIKSYDDLKVMLNEHFFCGDPESSEDKEQEEQEANPIVKSVSAKTAKVDDDDDDDVPSYDDDDTKVKDILASMDL
tara:strand:+ start:6272 stop:7150 length:879 start_codon:yes stop_codon:yes gene_type:complete